MFSLLNTFLTQMYSPLNALQGPISLLKTSAYAVPVSFGDVLGKYLKGRGKRAEFARAAGISPQQVTNMIAGRRVPTREEAEAWAGILKLTPNDRAVFISFAGTERAKRRKENEATVAELQQQIGDLRRFCIVLYRKAVERGIKLPQEQVEKFSFLKEGSER